MKGINTHTRTALMCDAMYIKKDEPLRSGDVSRDFGEEQRGLSVSRRHVACVCARVCVCACVCLCVCVCCVNRFSSLVFDSETLAVF